MITKGLRLMSAPVFVLALGLYSGTASAEGGVTAVAGDAGRGVALWADSCGRCHNVRAPQEFRDDQWKVIMTHMRTRAGLTGQDTRDILAFLQAAN